MRFCGGSRMAEPPAGVGPCAQDQADKDTMKVTIPTFGADQEAQDFVDNADLAD